MHPQQLNVVLQLKLCLHQFFFFSSRRRHTRSDRDWSSDVCSSDLLNNGTSDPFGNVTPLRLLVGQTVNAITVADLNQDGKLDLVAVVSDQTVTQNNRSEEHTSELQSRSDLVCRLLLEKKKTYNTTRLPSANHGVRSTIRVAERAFAASNRHFVAKVRDEMTLHFRIPQPVFKRWRMIGH